MYDAAATRSSFAIEIVKGGRLPASAWSDETAPLTDIARARVERVDNRATFQASDEIQEKRESERKKSFPGNRGRENTEEARELAENRVDFRVFRG